MTYRILLIPILFPCILVGAIIGCAASALWFGFYETWKELQN